MRYTAEHHWLRAESGFVVVGITSFATEQLGTIVLVELPEKGATVVKGEEIAVVESSKAVSDIPAPISGQIVAVNMALEGNPNLVNADPLGNGWFFKMSVADPTEINGMMDDAGYKAFTG